MAPFLLDTRRSQLLVIDVQEGMLPHVRDPEQLVSRVRILVTSAEHLGVPVLFAEQYPQGLGQTVVELREKFPNIRRVPKTTFSCAANSTLLDCFEREKAAGRPQILIAGIESHVCVLQSAIDLQHRGFQVAVIADAVSSRAQGSIDLALQRMQQAGIIIVNTEMVVFEWLERSDRKEFKLVSTLIR